MRQPDPERLLSAYFHSTTTLNYIRSLLTSGYASLNHPRDWSLSHVQSPDLRLGKAYFLNRLLAANSYHFIPWHYLETNSSGSQSHFPMHLTSAVRSAPRKKALMKGVEGEASWAKLISTRATRDSCSTTKKPSPASCQFPALLGERPMGMETIAVRPPSNRLWVRPLLKTYPPSHLGRKRGSITRLLILFGLEIGRGSLMALILNISVAFVTQSE